MIKVQDPAGEGQWRGALVPRPYLFLPKFLSFEQSLTLPPERESQVLLTPDSYSFFHQYRNLGK